MTTGPKVLSDAAERKQQPLGLPRPGERFITRSPTRDAALRLIGVRTDDDYRVTTTLQLVQSELGDSIGLLAQGSWTLRSLAAILWAESLDMPDELGSAFSHDRDVRVRRALANALANAEHRQDADARDILLRDPRWSVRSILRQAAAPPPD